MGGGLSKGELGVILAAFGVGKTTLITRMANTAYKMGKNVVQIFFEDNAEVIQRKHYTCFTEIPLNELEERSDEINILLEEKQDELDERVDDDQDFFGTEEYEELKEEIGDLEIELSDKQTVYEGLGDELRELYDTARQELYDTIVSDIISEIDNDGVDYFVNNLGVSFSEAVDYYCTFDESGLEKYLAENEDRGNTLSGYDGIENEVYYNGETYYIYRTD